MFYIFLPAFLPTFSPFVTICAGTNMSAFCFRFPTFCSSKSLSFSFSFILYATELYPYFFKTRFFLLQISFPIVQSLSHYLKIYLRNKAGKPILLRMG